MSADHLVYLFDPLCGWCYGAGPGLDRLSAANAELELVPTAMFAGEGGRDMDAEFAQYIWSNDQRIAALTGVTFSEVYRSQVLAAGGLLDSTLATLALVAAGPSTSPERLQALKALQLGRFDGGRSLTEVDSVTAILSRAGLSAAAQDVEEMSDDLIERTNAETRRGQLLMRKLGARGVPTLARQNGDALQLLSSKALFEAGAPLI